MNLQETIQQNKDIANSSIPENGMRDAVSQAIVNNQCEHDAYEEFIEKFLQEHCEMTAEINYCKEDIATLNTQVQYLIECNNELNSTLNMMEVGIVICIITLGVILVSNLICMFKKDKNGETEDE